MSRMITWTQQTPRHYFGVTLEGTQYTIARYQSGGRAVWQLFFGAHLDWSIAHVSRGDVLTWTLRDAKARCELHAAERRD